MLTSQPGSWDKRLTTVHARSEHKPHNITHIPVSRSKLTTRPLCWFIYSFRWNIKCPPFPVGLLTHWFYFWLLLFEPCVINAVLCPITFTEAGGSSTQDEGGEGSSPQLPVSPWWDSTQHCAPSLLSCHPLFLWLRTSEANSEQRIWSFKVLGSLVIVFAASCHLLTRRNLVPVYNWSLLLSFLSFSWLPWLLKVWAPQLVYVH